MIIFEVKDKTGRSIYLTLERWNHIIKHPEMQETIREIEKALDLPQKMTLHKYDENIRNYYLLLKEKKKFLKVIVKYLNGKGFIITAYLVEYIQ